MNFSNSESFPIALIVDCCGHTRMVCLTALDRVGYQVYETDAVVLAMKLFAQQKVDFLVLDLPTVMVQGYTISEIISSSPADLRIALLTPHPALVPKNITTRVNHIIYKPINSTQLMTHALRLKDMLRHREC